MLVPVTYSLFGAWSGMGLLSILITLILLNVVVIVHEFGHYLTARLFGVRVLEFSIGFGPVLAKAVHKGIQYSIRAVPVGGFVKMAGMEMALEGEPAPEAMNDRGSLRKQPLWKRITIILAGPVNNLILAGIVLGLTLAFIGDPVDSDKRPIIGYVTSKTPAYEAGLTAGDRIKSIGGQKIDTWNQMAGAIAKSKGRPLEIVFERRGRILRRTAKPMLDPSTNTYKLMISPVYIYKRQPLGQSIRIGFQRAYQFTGGIIYYLARAIRGKEKVGLMGPVGMVGEVNVSIQSGPWWVAMLLAQLNLFLFLFNLLPIPLPLLDGGWVVIYLIEAVRRKEFTDEQKAAAQFFGLLVIVALFLFVTYGDIMTRLRRFLNR